jgi:hypothetical protein
MMRSVSSASQTIISEPNFEVKLLVLIKNMIQSFLIS